MQDWIHALIHAAEEEQVHGLGSNPLARRRCSFGCEADETAYHVATACPTAVSTARHDSAAYHILHAIMKATATTMKCSQQ